MRVFKVGDKVEWKSGSVYLKGRVLCIIPTGKTLKEVAHVYFRAYKLTPISRHLKAVTTRNQESYLISVSNNQFTGNTHTLHWPQASKLSPAI